MPALIGITMSYEDGVHRLRNDYVRAVACMGAIPLAVCASDGPAGDLVDLVERLDGLIVTGGPAVTRGLIGDLPNDIARTDPLRESFDADITDAFMRSAKPILGICYGMQLMNALAGGTIYADVQKQVERAAPHSPKRGGDTHDITIDADSRLARVLGTDRATVNTRHIQGVAEPGASFIVSARSVDDGVIEAIESTDGRMLGVQFHPELMGMGSIFEAFVARATSERAPE